MNKPDLATALIAIQQEESLDDRWLDNCNEVISKQNEVTPWYVKAMLGISAWLSMIFIIIFLVTSKLVQSEEAAIIFGIILVPLACLIRAKSESEFQKQISLAISMAGQTLLYIGIVASNHNAEASGILTAAFFALIISLVLIKVYQDKIHRFISTFIMIGAITVIIERLHIPFMYNALPFFISALAVYLTVNEQAFLQKNWSAILRPVQYGLLFSLLFIFLPTNSFLARELSLFSHLHLSTIGVGITLLYLEYIILQKIGLTVFNKTSMTIFNASILFVIATLPAPGIITSFLVILLGCASGEKVLKGAGTVFLVWYISNYYYFMNISLLEKSISLISTGAVLLTTRYIIKHWRGNQA